MSNPQREDLRAEYAEVCSQFRALTDIRFKLLGFLPLGTVGAVLVSEGDQFPEATIAAFGLVVTLCVATYNKRNDDIYFSLIDRAQELERTLKLGPQACFTGGPRIQHLLEKLPISHSWPIRMVYGASAALWAYAIVHRSMQPTVLALQCWTVGEPLPWIVAAVVLAIWMGIGYCREKKRREFDQFLRNLWKPFSDRNAKDIKKMLGAKNLQLKEANEFDEQLNDVQGCGEQQREALARILTMQVDDERVSLRRILGQWAKLEE